MSYGFVYVLGNLTMPGIYKIGRTDRSPSARCAELSSATAIAMPFDVVLAAEVYDPASMESRLHLEYAEKRVNAAREFFRLSDGDIFEIKRALEAESTMVTILVGTGFVDVQERREYEQHCSFGVV